MTVGWEVLKEDVPILTHPLVLSQSIYPTVTYPDGTFSRMMLSSFVCQNYRVFDYLICVFIVSTHVLDKQIDKMLHNKGVPDGMAHPVC